MLSRRLVAGCGLGLVVLSGAAYFLVVKTESTTKQGFVQKERVIAGSPKDSLEVRHLILKGTNEEIGYRLAELAIDRCHVPLQSSQDPLRTRVQRRYIAQNYPILFERMRGVARAFGKRLDDDAWVHSDLNFTELKAGCSIMYLPAHATALGSGVVSRDYDYSTGSISFGPLPPGQLHPTARPYLLELHPDRGYASLAMTAYELLSGTLDGINSEGLTVALAMDDEIFSKSPVEPIGGSAVGLGVLQVLRMLLDTCATAEEAKEALLANKQYYEFVPCHYLIADRFGNAFVWEYSQAHNKEFIIEDPNQPLIMTNFSLNRHLDKNRPPSAEQARTVCGRYCLLTEALGAAPAKMTPEFIKQTHKKVDAESAPSATPGRPPVRTFWHALYYPEERRMEINFYLRDEPVPGQPNKVRVVRSDYQEFRLTPTDNARPPQATASRQPEFTPSSNSQAAPPEIEEAQQSVIARLKEGGAVVQLDRGRISAVNLSKAPGLAGLLPLMHKLPDLASLTVATKKLNDAGMAALAGLPNLSVLIASNSAVGDEGLKIVKTLPNLRTLYLKSTNVTDAGLAHLKDATQLEVLILTDVKITDAGLAHLESLTNMTGLFLGGTGVTDTGLEHLKGMRRLTKLNLTNTRVTKEGLARIKKSLPSWIMIEHTSK